MKNIFLGVLVSVVAIVGSVQAQEVSSKSRGDSGGLDCKFIQPIQKLFLNYHVSVRDADAQLKNRVTEQYIKRLDPTKIIFTSPDVEEVKKKMANIFESIEKANCEPLMQVNELYLKRVKERANFAKLTLNEKFNVDKSLEFEFDADKKPFAPTKEEIEKFLVKYIQFQTANYLATDMKIGEARDNVKKNYDRMIKRATDKKIADIYADYLDSFARSLDPHSSFFSKDVLEDFRISMTLSLEGIGATLSSTDGFTVVESLVPGGAAARSGLVQPQDKIIAVGQGEKGQLENVIEMDLRDVVAKIRGKKGTKVKLSILRKSGDKKDRFEVVLVRDKVKLEDEAVSIKYIDQEINGQKKKIGVIDLPSFYAGGGRSSANDLKSVIEKAVAKGVSGIVLDLSNNGGGSLDDAVKIAGLFFKTGNVVKQSLQAERKGEIPLADTDSKVDYNGPLVVLTSRISASASEIVSGTLKDYRRAVILGGDHTFGKGSIQTVQDLPNALGAIKVTVGMFFTPSGNSTQHRGVEADIALPSAWNSDDIGEKSLDYSLPPKKIEPFISQEAFVTEGPSLWKAIEPQWIKTLKERSEARVTASKDFAKIQEEALKAQKQGKIIKLSDVLKDKAEKEKKDKKKKTASKDEKAKEYLKRADIKEAVSVLTDLIALENNLKLPVVAATTKEKDSSKKR